MAFKQRVKSGYIWVRDRLEYLEKDPFIRAAVALVFLVTAWQLLLDIEDRREERTVRLEEREERQKEDIARAWQILTTPAAGNSGKAQALETLFRAGVSLRGIDLSCETMGGGWDEDRLKCDRLVDLTGVDLSSPNGISNKVNIVTVDPSYFIPDSSVSNLTPWRDICLAESYTPSFYSFWDNPIFNFERAGDRIRPLDELRYQLRQDGVDLRNAKLSGVDLSFANITGANLQGADLRGSVLHGTVAEGVLFENTLLQGMKITASILSGSQIGLSVGACDAEALLEDREADACDGDRFKSKIRIQGSKLDGVEIVYPHAEHLSISNSSAINSYVEISRFPNMHLQFKEDIEPDSIAEHWGSSILHVNDFTCSIFKNDRSIRLTGSNISRASFPPRYTSTDETNSDEKQVVDDQLIDRPGWDDDMLFKPWAWSDQPPKGNLGLEKVAACDPEGVRMYWAQNKTQARSPKNCEITDYPGKKSGPPATFHKLTLPPPATGKHGGTYKQLQSLFSTE